MFWASQSGTSQRLAVQYSRQIATTFGRTATVIDLSDIDVKSIAQLQRTTPAIFLLSTYGEGNPPDNGVAFLEWLSDLQGPHFDTLHFAILGFGNSTYKYFNKFALDVQDRLEVGGATSLLCLEGADDGKGLTEETFFSWSEKSFKMLCNRFQFSKLARSYSPAFTITYGDHNSKGVKSAPSHGREVQNARAMARLSEVHEVPLAKIESISSDPSAECLHIDLDISANTSLKYETGDHLGVWPKNLGPAVDALRCALGILQEDMQRELNLQGDSSLGVSGVERPMTMVDLFTRRLEICRPMPRQVLQDLIQFAPTSQAKDWLSEVGSSSESFSRFKANHLITMASILKASSPDLPWDIPLAFVTETLGFIQPRYYSIASASTVHPRQISLTAGMLRLPLEHDQKSIYGLTSSNFLELAAGSTANTETSRTLIDQSHGTVYCHVRKSSFHPPASPSQPMLLIATGTGIAPFRGFVQQRARLHQVGQNIGKIMLIYGCRSSRSHLYKQEIEEAQSVLGANLEVIVAYSRIADRPRHLQDSVSESSSQIVDMIVEQKARVYLCGSTKMAKDAGVLIEKHVSACMHWTPEQAGTFLAQLRIRKQWIEDVWG